MNKKLLALLSVFMTCVRDTAAQFLDEAKRKAFEDKLLDALKDYIEGTVNKVDDVIVLPFIDLIREKFDIPDEPMPVDELITKAVVVKGKLDWSKLLQLIKALLIFLGVEEDEIEAAEPGIDSYKSACLAILRDSNVQSKMGTLEWQILLAVLRVILQILSEENGQPIPKGETYIDQAATLKLLEAIPEAA